MPATEQTWRSTSLLHKIFAVSGMILLVSTIWMFAKDHARPWKPYQRTANQVELTLTDWRKLQFETNEAVAEHTVLVEQLDKARRQAIEWELVKAFIEHKHWGCHGPVIIDARIKPHHAPPLIEDEKVKKKVDRMFSKGGALEGLG